MVVSYSGGKNLFSCNIEIEQVKHTKASSRYNPENAQPHDGLCRNVFWIRTPIGGGDVKSHETLPGEDVKRQIVEALGFKCTWCIIGQGVNVCNK